VSSIKTAYYISGANQVQLVIREWKNSFICGF